MYSAAGFNVSVQRFIFLWMTVGLEKVVIKKKKLFSAVVLAPKPDFTSDVYNSLNIFYFVPTLKGEAGFEIIASLPGFGQLTQANKQNKQH